MRRLMILLLAWLAHSAYAADAQLLAADPALEARVHALTVELRCLVCQNQTVAESTAPLAIDLKDQVREQLRAGKSQEEILKFMTDRYGDFVLYNPPLKASTVLLWGGPAALLLLGLVGLWRTLRQRAAAPKREALTPQQRERATNLLGGSDEA